MTGQRILGLDVGDRTVGVAASDLLLMTAQGVETIRRETLEKDLARLGELMREYDAVRLVVGLPRNMNGTEGDRCEIVRAFAEEIKKALPEADIIFWDERLSTVAAVKSLIQADVSRKKRKKVIDKMAAVFILQGYLDSLAK
ncbi:MAG: Holliday junction resolvase RuvX [Schwartzia succinivorans]|jgi:putative Holliday junction resolvase|nr:Holliday junction resolvase RuvX [Schwartzia succinivorans]